MDYVVEDKQCERLDESSTVAAIAQADRLVMRRWKANARERLRVQMKKTGFELLRRILPTQQDECHLTRMDVLCRAMEYIRCLEREAHGDGPEQPPLLTIVRSSTTSTCTGAVNSTLEPTTFTHEKRRQRRDSGYSELSFLSVDIPTSEYISERMESTSDYESDTNASTLQIRRRMLASRITANRQLRARSKKMQKAFQDLRDVVPVDPNSPHLSKAKVLRQASMYIGHMRSLLDESA